MPDTAIILYADGLCEPNPGGWACWGWLALDADGAITGSGQGCVGDGANMTNNVAEYAAVLAALRWAWKAGHRTATVRTDSQLLVNQVNGAWDCHAPRLQPLLAQVRKAAGLMTLRFEWVPREENTAADERSLAAYRAATGCEPPDRHPKPAPPPGPTPATPGDHCTSCGASIVWARHRVSNKPAPLDAVPGPGGNIAREENGNYYIVPEAERAGRQDLYLNHYVTCPQRDAWAARAGTTFACTRGSGPRATTPPASDRRR